MALFEWKDLILYEFILVLMLVCNQFHFNGLCPCFCFHDVMLIVPFVGFLIFEWSENILLQRAVP